MVINIKNFSLNVRTLDHKSFVVEIIDTNINFKWLNIKSYSVMYNEQNFERRKQNDTHLKLLSKVIIWYYYIICVYYFDNEVFII